MKAHAVVKLRAALIQTLTTYDNNEQWVSGAIVQLSGDFVEQVVDIGEFAERLYDELNRPKRKEEGHASPGGIVLPDLGGGRTLRRS